MYFNPDVPGSRRPIPVSLIEQDYRRTIYPASGLGFLIEANQLIIQQTVELTDCKYPEQCIFYS